MFLYHISLLHLTLATSEVIDHAIAENIHFAVVKNLLYRGGLLVWNGGLRIGSNVLCSENTGDIEPSASGALTERDSVVVCQQINNSPSLRIVEEDIAQPVQVSVILQVECIWLGFGSIDSQRDTGFRHAIGHCGKG